MWKNKKSGTRSDSRVCHWCSYHILTSSVIYYWTDARQHGIYLFYTIKKQTTTEKLFYFKIFQHDSKVGLCPALHPLWQTPTLTNIWRNLLSIKIKQSHWLLCVAKEFGLVQENHAIVKLDSSVAPCGMKSYSEIRIELRNLETVFVIRAALWAE